MPVCRPEPVQPFIPLQYSRLFCREWLVAIFCTAHSLLWLAVAFLDRVVQCQHQVMRRNGYLKFYRKMKNVHRVPFITVSVGEEHN